MEPNADKVYRVLGALDKLFERPETCATFHSFSARLRSQSIFQMSPSPAILGSCKHCLMRCIISRLTCTPAQWSRLS